MLTHSCLRMGYINARGKNMHERILQHLDMYQVYLHYHLRVSGISAAKWSGRQWLQCLAPPTAHHSGRAQSAVLSAVGHSVVSIY